MAAPALWRLSVETDGARMHISSRTLARTAHASVFFFLLPAHTLTRTLTRPTHRRDTTGGSISSSSSAGVAPVGGQLVGWMPGRRSRRPRRRPRPPCSSLGVLPLLLLLGLGLLGTTCRAVAAAALGQDDGGASSGVIIGVFGIDSLGPWGSNRYPTQTPQHTHSHRPQAAAWAAATGAPATGAAAAIAAASTSTCTSSSTIYGGRAC